MIARLLPESWTLSLTEEKQIDKIGIRLIKHLFNLPTTTPSAALLSNPGLLYMTPAVEKMQFMYLQQLLIGHKDEGVLLFSRGIKDLIYH